MRMPISLKIRCAAAFLAAAATTPSLAAEVIVGSDTSTGNCFPLSCGYLGNYQQVYSAGAFAGPTLIDTVSFFRETGRGNGSTINTGSYTFTFFITDRAVGDLDTDPSMNRTELLTNFGVYETGGVSPLVLSFSGTPFVYDPAVGNLLLDIQASGTAGSFANFQVDTTGTVTSRNYRGNVDNVGLVTQFSAVAQGSVPEPGSWALMLLGFGGIGVALRRGAHFRGRVAL